MIDSTIHNQHSESPSWSAAWLYWLPFTATVSIRLFCLHDFLSSPFFLPLGGDRGLYHRAAIAISNGSPPDVFSFMPLYPYLIGWLYRIVGSPNLAAVAILQAFLDGLTTLMIMGLAQRRYGMLSALFAGFGFSLSGMAILYSLVTMSVSLGLFWTALAATCTDLWKNQWTRRRAIMMGLVLGIGGQILGAFWLMIVPFGIWIAGSVSPLPLRQRCWMGALVILFGLSCLLPTLMHNAILGKQWIPVTTHSGLNFFMGNNSTCNGYGTALPGLRTSAEEMTLDSVTLASRLSGKPLTMAEADRYWKRKALEFWRQEPGKAFTLLLCKIHRLISVRDFDDTGLCRLLPDTIRLLRLPLIGWGLVWLVACAGYGLRPFKFHNPGLWIMALCLASGMLMTFVTARYRLPLAILLLPAAGGTLASLPAILRNIRRRISPQFTIGCAGIVVALIPHPLPNTALVDDLNRSNHWCQKGNYEKAVMYAQRAITISPDSPDAWFAIGNACTLHHDYSSALKAYTRVLSTRPDRTDALFNAGLVLERLGNAEDAYALYERIIELDPQHAKAWFALAILYRDDGDSERAVKAITEAAKLAGWNHPDIVEFLKQPY